MTDRLIPVAVDVTHTYVVWLDPDEYSDPPTDSAMFARRLSLSGDSYEYLPQQDPTTRACAPAGRHDYEWREAEPYDLSMYCEHRVPREAIGVHCDPCMQRESAEWRARRAAAEATP